jgi:hypothetical protein
MAQAGLAKARAEPPGGGGGPTGPGLLGNRPQVNRQTDRCGSSGGDIALGTAIARDLSRGGADGGLPRSAGVSLALSAQCCCLRLRRVVGHLVVGSVGTRPRHAPFSMADDGGAERLASNVRCACDEEMR